MPAKPLTAEQRADARRLKTLFESWKDERKRRGEPASQDAAAEILGFGQSATSQYLRGEIPLNIKALAKFTKLIGCAAEEISPSLAEELHALAEHISNESDASISAPERGKIGKSTLKSDARLLANTEPGPEITGKYPLISWVQAGAWETIVDNFAPGDAEQWLDAPVSVSGSSYYVKVKGESMYDPADRRSFYEGELALVDPAVKAENGSIVVVLIDGDEEATLRQLIIERGHKYLKALNPNWPNRIFEVNGNATICGVVKGKFVGGY